MPPTSEIIGGLTHAANTWSGIAVAWHVAIGVALAALVLGWRPTQRHVAVALILPLLSVAAIAWASGNPFNTAVFAGAAAGLGVMGLRLADKVVRRPSRAATTAGVAMITFGWVYPHFLEGGSMLRYVYAAPVGLVPCPTLSVVIGFALLASGPGSRTWSPGLAALGLFYGVFGVFVLGVWLDVGLIGGAAALAVMALRGDAESAGERTR